MRTPSLGFALLLVAVVAAAPVAGFAMDAGGTESTSGALASPDADDAPAGSVTTESLSGDAVYQQATNEDADATPRTTVAISLHTGRSASWRIETRFALDSANETRAFRSLAERYEAGEADAGPDATLFRALQQRASESTGRAMALRNVTYHGTVDEEANSGTLALTFRWTNFLRQGENETLVLDDVFMLPTAETDERRTWLSIFDDDQQILPPEGYTDTGTSIAVQKRESAIILVQPSDFEGEDEALEVTYSPAGTVGGLPIGLLTGGGLVAVAAILTGAWWIRRRDGDESAGGPAPAGPDGPSGPTPSTGDAPGTNEGRGSSGSTGSSGSPPGGGSGATGPMGDDAGAGAGTGPVGAADTDGSTTVARGPETVGDAGDAEADAGSEAEVDLSLLSDEERVEHLLSQNGGRMKQATIVDETGWSDAKVSQLLSAMADEGRVDKLRLGRENLISLPEGDGSDDDDGSEGAAGSNSGDGTDDAGNAPDDRE
jgi:hypothetical protein